MKRLLLISLSGLMLLVGCTSSEVNTVSGSEELPSLSTNDRGVIENVDANAKPTNQTYATTPAEAAPAPLPVNKIPVFKKAHVSAKRKHHKKAKHAKKSRKRRHHVAHVSPSE